MPFKVARYLFRLTATSEMHLPSFIGSTLRGGFGTAFRRSSCANPGVNDCKGCLLANVCAYSYCFATKVPPESEVLRNLGEIPRPFVIEPPDAHDRTIKPGESLSFGLVLIGRAIEYFPFFLLSFQRLGAEGMGSGRYQGLGRFEVKEVCNLGPWSDEPGDLVYDKDTGRVRAEAARVIDSSAIASRLEQFSIQPSTLSIRFLTMARLKSEAAYARVPEFHILLRALLRRISALSYFHGGERIEADYRDLAERAGAVRLVRNDTTWRGVSRVSQRHQSLIDLSGLVGEAEYEGDFTDFLPWLLWGQLVHAGKNATFGLGRIQVG